MSHFKVYGLSYISNVKMYIYSMNYLIYSLISL